MLSNAIIPTLNNNGISPFFKIKFYMKYKFYIELYIEI